MKLNKRILTGFLALSIIVSTLATLPINKTYAMETSNLLAAVENNSKIYTTTEDGMYLDFKKVGMPDAIEWFASKALTMLVF